MTVIVKQSTTVTEWNGATLSAASVSFGTTPVQGNTVLAHFSGQPSANTITGVTDNQTGNTYTVTSAMQFAGGGNNYGLQAYCHNVNASGTFTVSVNFSASSTTWARMSLTEVAGLKNATADATGSGVDTSSTAPAVSTSASTTKANCFVIATLAEYNGWVTGTMTGPTSNYTSLQDADPSSSYLGLSVGYKSVTTTGTQSAAWTTNNNQYGMAVIHAFEEESAVIVQFPTMVTVSGVTASTFNISFASTPTAGNAVFMVGALNRSANGTTVSGVSDNQSGNDYTVATADADYSGGGGQYVNVFAGYDLEVSASGTFTLTVTLSSSASTDGRIGALEVAGLKNQAVNASGTVSNFDAQTNDVTVSTSGATTAADCWVLGVLGLATGWSADTISGASGYRNLYDQDAGGSSLGFSVDGKFVSSTGTQTCAWTHENSNLPLGGAIILAFATGTTTYQYSDPTSTLYNSDGWTKIGGGTTDPHLTVDEGATPNDSDGVESAESPSSDVIVFGMADFAGSTPSSARGSIRYKKSEAGGDTISLIAQWRKGYVNEGTPGTLVATLLNNTDISGTITQVDYDLTSGECAAVDPSDIVLRLVANKEATAGIVYVGGQKNGFAGKTGTTTVTFSLTGGTDSTPQAGDLVIVSYCVGSTADRALTIRNASSTDYTLIGSELYQNDTYDVNLRCAYRFMPSPTPETTMVLSGTGSIQDAGSYTIHVFRNVDPNTPLDVTAVTAGGTDTRLANPNAITPTTAGAIIYVVGAAACQTAGVYTASYLSGFQAQNNSDTNDSMVGAGYVAWTSGQYDPAAFTGGGTDTTSDSWAALTVALRPATATRKAQVTWARFRAPEAAGNVYNESISEAGGTTSDSVSAAHALAGTASESAGTMVDVASATFSPATALANEPGGTANHTSSAVFVGDSAVSEPGGSAADNVTGGMAFEASAAESGGLPGETATGTKIAAGAVAEPTSAADQVLTTLLTAQAVMPSSEASAGAQENVAAQLVAITTISESVPLTEFVAGGTAFVDSVDEPGGLPGETATGTKIAAGTVSEPTSAADQVLTTLLTAQAVMPSSEASASAQESVAAQHIAIATISESAPLDAVSNAGLAASALLASEGSGPNDTYTVTQVHTVLLTEANTPLDNLVTLMTQLATATESNSVADSMEGEIAGGVAAVANQTAMALDNVSAGLIAVSSVEDVTTLAYTSAVQFSYQSVLTETSLLDAQVSAVVILQGTTTEVATLLNTAAAQLLANANTTAEAIASDVVGGTRSLSDVVTELGLVLADQVQFSISQDVQVAEVALAEDVLTAILYSYWPMTTIERDAVFQLAYQLATHYQVVAVRLVNVQQTLQTDCQFDEVGGGE